ncbi:hypothetical protein BGX38DRAFT_1259756, partial [Terfezia claveryi]
MHGQWFNPDISKPSELGALSSTVLSNGTLLAHVASLGARWPNSHITDEHWVQCIITRSDTGSEDAFLEGIKAQNG